MLEMEKTGEIENAREKNNEEKERFQKRQENMSIKALVEAHPRKETLPLRSAGKINVSI